LAVFFGGETLKQILARIQEKTQNKEIKATLKKVAKAQAIVDQYEEAKKTIAENHTNNV
jgi:3-dehydroquinate dehydratase